MLDGVARRLVDRKDQVTPCASGQAARREPEVHHRSDCGKLARLGRPRMTNNARRIVTTNDANSLSQNMSTGSRATHANLHEYPLPAGATHCGVPVRRSDPGCGRPVGVAHVWVLSVTTVASQGRADLVDVHFDHAALVPGWGVVAALRYRPGHDHPAARGQGLGGVAGTVHPVGHRSGRPVVDRPVVT